MTKPAYIALTEKEAAKVQKHAKLEPEIFDHKPSNRFFKLFRTEGEAVNAALQNFSSNSVRAATAPTNWFVLKLKFTQEQWLELLLSNEPPKPTIIRGSGRKWPELHVSGDLPVDGVALEWLQFTQQLELLVTIQVWLQDVHCCHLVASVVIVSQWQPAPS